MSIEGIRNWNLTNVYKGSLNGFFQKEILFLLNQFLFLNPHLLIIVNDLCLDMTFLKICFKVQLFQEFNLKIITAFMRFIQYNSIFKAF